MSQISYMVNWYQGYLCILRCDVKCGVVQVIKLISQVIADFASGEISQQEYQFDTDITLQQYLGQVLLQDCHAHCSILQVCSGLQRCARRGE